MNEEEDGIKIPSRYKRYLKVNLISLFFIGVSFISITLAWFAYSGLARTSLDVNVKAWYIEFEKDSETVSNEIVISLPDISPGMETVNEIVNIKNLGDSDATINYKVTSARIFDEEYVSDTNGISAEELEDIIAHDYPIHVNIDLSRHYAKAQEEDSVFDVSVSWPLDSGSDSFDSEWGNKAYEFQKSEEAKQLADPNYQVRTAIKIIITITAEQYMTTGTASDFDYNLGDLVIYDIVNKKGCNELGPTCILTHVINTNSTLGEASVTLLPDVLSTYETSTYNDYDTALAAVTSSWNATTRALQVEDLINIVSTDVLNTIVERNLLSDSIMGKFKSTERLEAELAKIVEANGQIKYDSTRYNFLTSNKCYWTSSEYNIDKGFAFRKQSDTQGRIYGEDKDATCSVIPVIIAKKNSL